MAIKLYTRGFDYAKELVGQGRFVLDDRDMWSEHQPSTQEEKAKGRTMKEIWAIILGQMLGAVIGGAILWLILRTII